MASDGSLTAILDALDDDPAVTLLPSPPSHTPTLSESSLPPSIQLMRRTPQAVQAMQDKEESVVTPWWEQYLPPKDNKGKLTVDMRREFQAGLRPKSLGHRLRQNGVAEMALETLTELAQDIDNPKVRLEAAKTLLAYAHGEPDQAQKQAPVQLAIVVDV